MTTTRRNFFTNSLRGAVGLSIGSLGVSLKTTAAEKNTAQNIKKIPTVAGTVDSDKMGITLMHEHLLHHVAIPPEKERQSLTFALQLLKDAERVGVNTIVDLSPTRDVRLYQQLAKEVSVNIIVSTGAYLQRRMPESLIKLSEAEFKAKMKREISEGIDGTGIRAGIIKVAAQNTPLTTWEMEKFRAAGQVQKELDVPVATHATHNPGNHLDILMQNGANPRRLYFCHSEAKFGWAGKSRELMAQEMKRIAKLGGSLLFNNFEYGFDTPWEDFVYLIRYLCDHGCKEQVLTSMDCGWDWHEDKIVVNAELTHPEVRKKTFAYAITDAIPDLLKAGFSAKEIERFFVKNPAKIFS